MRNFKAITYITIAAMATGYALPAMAEMSESKTTVTKTDGNGSQWTSEDHYWQDNYVNRPYYKKETTYSTYQPAYRYGVEVYNQHPGKRFEDLDQAELRTGWEKSRGNSNLDWDQARDASHDAYTHVYERRTTERTE